MKIGQKQISENPFYGKGELLSLSESIKKKKVTKLILDQVYISVKTHEDRELFHVLNFSGGDRRLQCHPIQ